MDQGVTKPFIRPWRVLGEGQSPQKLVLGCWGLAAPFAHAPLLCDACRAGGLGGHSARHCGPATTLGWRGDRHRVGWRGTSGFSCTRYCVCWVPGVLLCRGDPWVEHLTSKLVHEELGSIPELSVFW